MKTNNIIVGFICLITVFLLLAPNIQAANSNCQKVAGNTEWPGLARWKEPAIDSNEQVTALVYVRDPDYTNPNDVYRVWMAISINGGTSWIIPHTQVSTLNSDNEQRYPDVKVTKMDIEGTETTMIYVIWQELASSGIWEIWVRNFTVSGQTVSAVKIASKISVHSGQYCDALYPRIDGYYLPSKHLTGSFYQESSTMVIATYQQEQNINDRYKVYYDFAYHETDYSVGPNPPERAWPGPYDLDDELNFGESNSYENPSVDVWGYHKIIIEDELEIPFFDMIISMDEKYYSDTDYRVVAVNNDWFGDSSDTNSFGYDWGSDIFNSDSSTYGYPDCSVYFETDSSTFKTVAWQDDDNNPKAQRFGFTNDPTVDLGSCKDPSRKGISIDHTTPEYDPDEDVTSVIAGWTNPGGIRVIWMSNVQKPSSEDTYGIDSQALEYKTDLRVIHDYSGGEDDSDQNVTYDPAAVYHETTDPTDRYIDLKIVDTLDGHVSFQRDVVEIWYFTLDDYV